MRSEKQKLNNQGSTIIIVLVAVAFIMILATTSLTMSAANVNMKSVERKSKENFYSAESALDELKANLEAELSTLVTTVYTNTMIAYSDIPLGERNEKFKKEFLSTYLKQYAENEAGVDTAIKDKRSLTYSCEQLQNLLVKTKSYTEITSNTNNLEWKLNTKDASEQYICFRNITFNYVGENKYTSRIVTDIKVSIPDVNLETISNIPPFAEYALIADTKLFVNHAAAEVVGNVYAGAHGILVDGSSTSLNIEANQVITRGTIKANTGGKVTLQDQDGISNKYTLDVWATNIETDTPNGYTGGGAEMNLSGNFYIADDTTLNAPNSKVTYNGNYYGYGYGDTADTSSAMILNSQKSTLDLRNIVNLFIAGRAFVEPPVSSSNILTNTSGLTSKYVRTGEAISTKGNQAIYRLPDDCIGVVKKDGTTSSIGTNPMSVEVYQKLLDAKDTILVDTDYVLPFSNKSLKEYVNASDPYCMIFDQLNESTSYVYFYPNFKDEKAANQYFQDYYNSKDSKYRTILLDRMKEYGTMVLAPDNFNSRTGRKTYAGNTVFYKYSNDSEDFLLDGNSVDAKLPQQFVDESNDLAKMYQAYCTKLLPSLSSYTESELKEQDTLFQSLIVEISNNTSRPGVKELLGGATSKEFKNAQYGSFLLVDNQTTKENESMFGEKNVLVVDNTVSDEVRLIIATGDVHVKRNFKGIIISKGIIRLDDGVKIEADSEKVFSLVANTDVKTAFRDYNSFANDMSATKNEEIRMKDLITVENWKKD